MKLGLVAATALLTIVGAASTQNAASAQNNDSTRMTDVGRTSPTDLMGGSANRITVLSRAPALEGARPAAGMLPQPTGPVRGISGGASNAPHEGSSLQPNAIR